MIIGKESFVSPVLAELWVKQAGNNLGSLNLQCQLNVQMFVKY